MQDYWVLPRYVVANPGADHQRDELKKTKFALAGLALATATTANATVLTVSMSGYINTGSDYLGLFLPWKGVARGQPYSLTVSVNWDMSSHYKSSSGSTSIETSGPFVVSATVAGVNYTFGVVDNVDMHAYVSTSGGVTLFGTGTDAFGRQVHIQESVTQAIQTKSLTDYLSVSGLGDSMASFSVGTGPSTGFDAVDRQNRTFVMNGAPATLPLPTPIAVPQPASNPVPEPATAMLFGAGLLGLATLRRRFRR